jgi:hypothetical protein
MYKFKQSLAACAGVLALVGLVSLLTPLTIHSQTGSVGPTKPVLVVNSPSEPVPVTGTVNVGNLGGSPLPVRDMDGPNAGNIVTLVYESDVFIRVSSSGVKDANQYTIPSGKALIITNVNWCIDRPATEAGKRGSTSLALLSGTSPNFVDTSIYFGDTILGNDGNGCESDTLTTGAAVAAGTPIITSAGSNVLSMIIHGYLVDVP